MLDVFRLMPGGNDVLIVSSVGFTTQEVPLNGRNSLTIRLISGAKNLDEVVAIGRQGADDLDTRVWWDK